MATTTRHDDQGNIIHIDEEGEYHDAKGQDIGDDRGQGAPDPHNP